MFIVFHQLHSQKINSLNNNEKEIDSLKNVILKTKSDSIKCIAHFKIAHLYNSKDLGLRKFYLKKANDFIEKNNYLKDVSYYFKSFDYYIDKDFEGFKKALLIAIERLEKYNNSEVDDYRYTMFYNLAICYQVENNNLEATKIIIHKLIPICKKSNYLQGLAKAYRFLGVLFYNNVEYKKAEYYLNLAIQTIEKESNKSGKYSENLLEIFLFYVEILAVQEKFDKASQYLNKAHEKLKEYPSSNFYINYLSAKANLEFSSKKYEKSLKTFNEGIEKALLIGDDNTVIRFKLFKIIVLKELEKFEESKNLLLEILNVKNLPISDKKNYIRELAVIYGKMNDLPNSIANYERYIFLNDSINQENTKSKILELEAKYNYSKNENKIKELTIEKQATLLKQKRTRTYHLMLVFAFACLLIFTYFVWKNLKNQKKLSVQKEINHIQKLDSLKREKEIEIMQAMINVEETERKRVARDLHDSIGSKLSALKIIFSSIETKNNYDKIKINTILETSITELRHISYNLVPESLLKLGLEKALSDLCFSLLSNRISIEFQSFEIDNSLPIEKQTNIFRIVQEILNNALKHSNCSHILVSCSQNSNRFYISVEDNGSGFDLSKIEDRLGLGLKSIKSRIELLNGILDCESNNNGTSYNIELEI